MVKNKPGTHFNRKAHCSDGYDFDSEKEHQFYHSYIKHCGYRFKIHPTFKILSKFSVGGMSMKGITYTPDFVVYESFGEFKHVYDVKTSTSIKGTGDVAKNKFKRFAFQHDVPVEVVVPRTHDFKMTILGLTKSFEPQILTSVDYDVHDYIGR